MNPEELIKELDPDYARCHFCARLLHKNQLYRQKTYYNSKHGSFVFSCFDRDECLEYCESNGFDPGNRS